MNGRNTLLTRFFGMTRNLVSFGRLIRHEKWRVTFVSRSKIAVIRWEFLKVKSISSRTRLLDLRQKMHALMLISSK
jgi:hypothetical protein